MKSLHLSGEICREAQRKECSLLFWLVCSFLSARFSTYLGEARVSPKVKVVIFHAHEGYTTSLSLDYIMEKDIIMAYKMNGVVLPPERDFPFQLVAEDKWGYKWIKWIEKIELSDDVNYKGYWEKRDYSNEGDLDKDFLE